MEEKKSPSLKFSLICLFFTLAALGGISILIYHRQSEVSRSFTISLTNHGFLPKTLQIGRGEKLVFKNYDDKDRWPASNWHPTHDLYPEFDPQRALSPGQEWAFQFDKTGAWGFHDHLYPQFTGMVIVRDNKSLAQSILSQFSFAAKHAKSISSLLGIGSNNSANGQKPFTAEKFIENLHAQHENVFEDTRKNFKEIAKQYGIAAVIGLTQTAYAQHDLTVGECHSLLHLIGHHAYWYYQKDLQKLAPYVNQFCATAFVHGVEAEIALANQRPYDGLRRFCEVVKSKDASIGCYHGAGHAFLEQTNDIASSLARCDALGEGQKESPDNCYGGVFSQFGNNILGFDGDTGLHFQPTVHFDQTHPLRFCLPLAERYQDQCVRQLVKVIQPDSTTDITESNLRECGLKDYPKTLQAVCAHVTALFYTENLLDAGKPLLAPPTFDALQTELRQNFIGGMYHAIRDFLASGGKGDTVSQWCDTFKQKGDYAYCKNFPVYGHPIEGTFQNRTIR